MMSSYHNSTVRSSRDLKIWSRSRSVKTWWIRWMAVFHITGDLRKCLPGGRQWLGAVVIITSDRPQLYLVKLCPWWVTLSMITWRHRTLDNYCKCSCAINSSNFNRFQQHSHQIILHQTSKEAFNLPVNICEFSAWKCCDLKFLLIFEICLL